MHKLVHVRPLRARDLWAVSRLFRSAFGGVTRAARYRALTRRKGAFVAACGAQVQGFYVAWRKESEPVVWLDYMAVAPAARRAGVGKALLEHCLGQAAAAGAVTVQLSMAAENAAAIEFYLAQGFTRTRVLQGGTRIHFTKAVAPAGPGQPAECRLGWRSLRTPAGALAVAGYTALLVLGDLVHWLAGRGEQPLPHVGPSAQPIQQGPF